MFVGKIMQSLRRLVCVWAVMCVLLSGLAVAAVAAGPYHGNVQSRIYHNSSCRYYFVNGARRCLRQPRPRGLPDTGPAEFAAADRADFPASPGVPNDAAVNCDLWSWAFSSP